MKPSRATHHNTKPIPLTNNNLRTSHSHYRKQISLANLFQTYGFPSPHLHDFLSQNHFLFDSDTSELRNSLATLFSFRIPQKTLVSLIRDCPGVLERRSLFLPRDEIDRVVRLYPKVLGFGVENKLKPLIEELRGLGFSRREVRTELFRDPRILGMEIGEISRCLRLLETLKCREAIKERIFGEGMLRACFEVKLRVDCLCGHGLIRRDALKVLWKEVKNQRLITYDLEEIEKIEFSVHGVVSNVNSILLWGKKA